MFDINPNSGEELYKAGDTLTATNLVFCNEEYSSKIILRTNEPLEIEERILENKSIIAYPNPFSEKVNFRFSLDSHGFTKLTIYNTLGYEIATLINEYLDAGNHEVTFDGTGFPSGTYFYILQSGSRTESGKLLLIK